MGTALFLDITDNPLRLKSTDLLGGHTYQLKFEESDEPLMSSCHIKIESAQEDVDTITSDMCPFL